jgi:transposase
MPDWRFVGERKAMDRALAAASQGADIGRRPMTIPGVGPVTNLAIDDPGRFSTSKALGAHLGLKPRVYQSGEIDRSGQISKCGDQMLLNFRNGMAGRAIQD